MLERLRARQEWQFFSVLPRADTTLAVAWWGVVALRGVLPAGFAVAMGMLVGAVQRGETLTTSLLVVGLVFVLLQVLNPILTLVSANLGDRTAAWLYDELTTACIEPPGMGHLEDPSLTNDLQVARDFDTGMTGPPLRLSLEFIATGLVDMLSGLASAAVLFAYAWWAPFLIGGGWLGTHWFLRESGIWKDRNTDEVRAAQRDSDYLYRLAVDPPAAKELRMFGLADWTMGRFISRRRRLHELQYEATQMRQKPVTLSLLVIVGANLVLLWALARDVTSGALDLGAAVVAVQGAIGASAIAFGGLNWALDGAAAPVAAVLRIKSVMQAAGALASGTRSADGLPSAELRFRDVTFAYPASPERPVLSGFDLTIPAGSSLAIVGVNGAGKTTLAKLLCRLYDPQSGTIEADGVDIRDLDIDAWRSRITAVFQDFIRFELPLRDNIAPNGAPDDVVTEVLEVAGATGLATLDTVLAKGYDGGTDLSGGQWQRVALARTLAAVHQGAGIVLLDEPTAQLDVRGEAEIFDRVLAATRHVTTILISHRFSTVRQADRICVVEDGAVVELGTHEELMAANGRYRTMFELQAQRFAAGLAAEEGEEEVVFDALT